MTEYNIAALESAGELIDDAESNRIEISRIAGATVADLGVDSPGGLAAGEMLAHICMGGEADIFASADPGAIGTGISVKVATDNPLWACLGCQYAGWPLSVEGFFGMTSGPIRLLRGKETMLQDLSLAEEGQVGVAVIESDSLPTPDAIEQIASDCNIAAENLTVMVAPTTSIAGNIQVVARSIETAMHKLHELGFDVRSILAATGSAPLPPPATKSIDGIGRTNDAILYGGSVTLIVDVEPEAVETLGPKVPSNSSSDFGKPFGEIFASYDHDFYKVDPHLFSPAVVTLVNLRTGRAHRYGELRADILEASFGG